MIELARPVDPEARAVRKRYEDEVEAVLNEERRAARQGALRRLRHQRLPRRHLHPAPLLRRGEGLGGGRQKVAPLTTIGGAFERATGEDPVRAAADLAGRARQARRSSTPMNFATTNDIIGGNSGSPLINREARDGRADLRRQHPSLGGDYGFDPADNRAVAVHGEAILTGLEKIYGATRLAQEIRDAADR